MAHTLRRFVLAAPGKGATRRKSQMRLEFALRLFYITSDGNISDIDEHVFGKQRVFVANHSRTSKGPNGSQLRDWNLLIPANGNQDLAKRFQVGAKIASVAHVYRVTLPILDNRADIFAADRCRQGVLRVLHR